MQEQTVMVSKGSRLLPVLCLIAFVLLSSAHICPVKDGQRSFFLNELSLRSAFATEEKAKEHSEEAATKEAAKEGEKEASGHGEEGEPVKYSIWQDFCAFIFAAIAIAAAYSLLKRRASRLPKEQPEHNSH